MSLAEMVDCWLKAHELNRTTLCGKEVRPEFAVYDLFGIDADGNQWDYRAVFWFDN
jgi:hypothetical protein